MLVASCFLARSLAQFATCVGYAIRRCAELSARFPCKSLQTDATPGKQSSTIDGTSPEKRAPREAPVGWAYHLPWSGGPWRSARMASTGHQLV